MNPTEQSCVVLNFSGAQIPPHSAKKDGIAGERLQKVQFLNFRQLSPAAQYSQNSGRAELVLLEQ